MTRNQLVKQLAEISTRPVGAASASDTAAVEPASNKGYAEAPTELFVWFEDTAARALEGRRGVAGLPESLLPISREMRLVERRYAENHLHLLKRGAHRLPSKRCRADRIALHSGTIGRHGCLDRHRQAIRAYVERHVSSDCEEIEQSRKLKKAPGGAFFILRCSYAAASSGGGPFERAAASSLFMYRCSMRAADSLSSTNSHPQRRTPSFDAWNRRRSARAV